MRPGPGPYGQVRAGGPGGAGAGSVLVEEEGELLEGLLNRREGVCRPDKSIIIIIIIIIIRIIRI